MKLLSTFACLCLLSLTLACSNDENTSEKHIGISVEKPNVDAPVNPREPETHTVVPINLSPEDQKMADKAPEGMVFIKGGCFTMGNEAAQADEKPEHEVCLNDFYLGKYEVTQGEWKKLMGFSPAKFIDDNHPVEQINFYDVQRYLEKSNGACRLPTEAEWEYAARGGANARYYWGNMMDGAYGWFEDNSKATTHPVGQKQPNQYGLYDMMGNVWEWVSDWYEPLYGAMVKENPTGPEKGESKVIRGGAFDSSAGALRITNRTWLHPKNRVYSKVSTYGGIINEIFNYVGFRCAKSIPKDGESAPKEAESNPAE
jgi:sulfatase modifying factor 1